MARPQHLALKRRPAPHQVAHALLGFSRNAHRGQLAVAIVARKLPRIVPIVLPPMARLPRDQRRRNDLAGIAPRLHGPLQYIAGSARLVAGPDLAFLRQSRKEAAQRLGSFGTRSTRVGFCGPRRQHRDHDRLLVHIEADRQNEMRRHRTLGWPSWLCDAGTQVPKRSHMALALSVRTEMLTDANPRGPAHSYLLRMTSSSLRMTKGGAEHDRNGLTPRPATNGQFDSIR